MTSWRENRWIGGLLSVGLFLLLGFSLFPAGGIDDAHITYWPAHTLACRGEIVNYNGEAVEQSSSLLLVCLLALLHVLTSLPVPELGWWVGIGSGALCVLATRALWRPHSPGAATTAAVLLVLSYPFVYWSFSGMETSLAALAGTLLVLALSGYLRHGHSGPRLLALLATLAAYVTARPEGMLVAGCVIAGAVVLLRTRRLNASMVLHLVLVFTATAAALIGWRLYSFGVWMPRPVMAKSAGLSAAALRQGLGYLREQPAVTAFVLLGTANAMRCIWRATRGGDLAPAVCGLFLIAQVSFVVLCGGDWMEGGRFLAPALPFAAVLVVDLAGVCGPRLARPIYVLVAAAVTASTLAFAQHESRSLTAWASPQKSYRRAAVRPVVLGKAQQGPLARHAGDRSARPDPPGSASR